jgi:hypothetical protein
MQNITTRMKIAPRLLRRATGNLLHPFLIWMPGDPGNTHAAAFEMQEEKHVVSHQPSPGEHFDCEKVTYGGGRYGYVVYFKDEDHPRAAKALEGVTTSRGGLT